MWFGYDLVPDRDGPGAAPAGTTVTDEFFDHMNRWRLPPVVGWRNADGLLLALHGAMVTPKHPDADAETLRRIRAVRRTEGVRSR